MAMGLNQRGIREKIMRGHIKKKCQEVDVPKVIFCTSLLVFNMTNKRATHLESLSNFALRYIPAFSQFSSDINNVLIHRHILPWGIFFFHPIMLCGILLQQMYYPDKI